jgi:hypothetical protein
LPNQSLAFETEGNSKQPAVKQVSGASVRVFPLLNRAANHGKTAEFGRKSRICRLPDRVMETVQMQTCNRHLHTLILQTRTGSPGKHPASRYAASPRLRMTGTNTFTDNVHGKLYNDCLKTDGHALKCATHHVRSRSRPWAKTEKSFTPQNRTASSASS